MVIHFAAITHVDESYRHRIDTIKDNIISTATLLESIVNRNYTGVKRFVHISTGIETSYLQEGRIEFRRGIRGFA